MPLVSLQRRVGPCCGELMLHTKRIKGKRKETVKRRKPKKQRDGACMLGVCEIYEQAEGRNVTKE